MNMSKMFVLAFAGCAVAASTFAEAGYVTNVLARQRWPWSHKVDIEFTVGGTESVDVEVRATWDGRQDPLVLTAGNGLSGAMYGLRTTSGHLVWDPHAAGITNTLTGFQVEVTSIDPVNRKWLVVDLKTGAHEFMKDEPEGGFNADDTYKISKMVFRRIPGGTFPMGITSVQKNILKSYGGLSDFYLDNYFTIVKRNVTLTDDYYLALYRLTEAQYDYVVKKDFSSTDANIFARNANNMKSCYNYFRGTNIVDEVVNWPVTRYAVADDSFFGRLRSLNGNRFMFDFPTEAQWERAARADSSKIWWDFGDDDITATQFTNYIASVCGGGARRKPGQYAPNAYGLYDMLGDGSELCLDAWSDALSGTVNPVGPEASPSESMLRVGKGGGHYNAKTSRCGCVVPACRMPHSANQSKDSSYGYVLFRPAIHLNSVFDK